MHFQYRWPRSRNARDRPGFLKAYPVPQGCLYNVNSFLGKKEVHGGKYLVPQQLYGRFLHQYLEALEGGYSLFCTENYQQQVYRYFVELDWDWDTPLDLVMEVTPRLLDLMQRVACEFYQLPHARTPVFSIRTPYKVHVNFPDLLTTELLANLCRDKILDACREQMPEYAGQVDWERLIDFPHGSLRLMGSRKSQVMDSDPAWVRDKAYHPARLVDGRWRPGRITASVLQAASIFPTPDRVAAFERSAAYLDMIYQDLAAYKQKLAERQQRRLERLAAAGRPLPEPSLPPGSSRQPLVVRLEVQPDDTVRLHVRVKAKYRTRGQQEYRGRGKTERRNGPGAGTGAQAEGQVEAHAGEQAEGHARLAEGRAGQQADGQAQEAEGRAGEQAEGQAQEVAGRAGEQAEGQAQEKGQGVQHAVEGAREIAGVADEALSGAGGFKGTTGDGRLAKAVVEGSGNGEAEATVLGKTGGEGQGGIGGTVSQVEPVQATV